MIANFLARIAARLIAWAIRLRGDRIVITRPWSGGRQFTFVGTFVGVEFERVHDRRGFVFYVKAAPERVSDRFMWSTPATRPHLIQHDQIRWSKEFKAWEKSETE